MLRIPRIDEELANLTKPELRVSGSFEISEEDCLILCAGFEERALAFLKNASHIGRHDFRVFVIKYLPTVNENRVSEIEQICRDSGLQHVGANYDRRDPAGFGDVFLGELDSVSGRLYIDVSGMSRLLIVQILVALGGRDCGGFVNLVWPLLIV